MLTTPKRETIQTWAATKTEKHWRGFWRLKKLGIGWQLKNANKIGDEIELVGPVIIENSGTIVVWYPRQSDLAIEPRSHLDSGQKLVEA